MIEFYAIRKDLAKGVESFKFNYATVEFTICNIYFVYFGLRTLFHLILQCIYLSPRETFISNMLEKCLISFESLKNFMVTTGQAYRGIGTTGIFYYSILFLSLVFFHIRNLIPGKQVFDYFEHNNFIKFMRTPEIEVKRIYRQIDFHLKCITKSNIEFTRKLMRESIMDEERDIGMPNIIVSGGMKKLSYRAKKVFDNTGYKPATHNNDHPDKEAKRVSYLSSKDILLYSLSNQLRHLNELSVDKYKVWPPNRNPIWAEDIKRFWITLDRNSAIFFWFVGQVCCCSITYLAYLSLSDFSGEYEKQEEFSFLDRFTCAEYSVYVYIGIDWFFMPLTVTVAAIRDQLLFIRIFPLKLLNICKQLKQIQSVNGDKEVRFENIKFNNNSLSYLVQSKFELINEIDREALELYIGYRLFRDDVRSSLLLAQHSLNKNIFFIVTSLMITLTFYNGIRASHWTPFLVTILFIIMTTNAALCMLAALHASCTHITWLVWNFVACVENYSLDQTLTNDLDHQKIGNLKSLNLSPNFLKRIDFDYLINNPINPHTLLLWRRLLEHHELIAEQYTCKVFGLFKMDYNCILKFNYWLVSVSLFVLANRG